MIDLFSDQDNILRVTVAADEFTAAASRAFDYQFNGTSEFTLPQFRAPSRDGSWNIGLIVGPSGSGKTQLLKSNYGASKQPEWDSSKAIVSHFSSPDEAIKRLSAVGLNTVPAWCRPHHVLSNGEQFRADMARTLNTDASVDEFTSVVDRTVAHSVSFAVQRYVRSEQMTGVVFSSCHYDIIDWLLPDWIFDLQNLTLSQARSLRRPEIKLQLRRCDRSLWGMFKNHHYLTASLGFSARCYVAMWESIPVAFNASIAMPSGSLKNAWRGHRTVVLPDYQGLGIGVRLSDAVAELFLAEGKRYFSRTAHPRMGEYRERSPLWRPTSKNKVRRDDYRKRRERGIQNWNAYKIDAKRMCWSHEYVGAAK